MTNYLLSLLYYVLKSFGHYVQVLGLSFWPFWAFLNNFSPSLYSKRQLQKFSRYLVHHLHICLLKMDFWIIRWPKIPTDNIAGKSKKFLRGLWLFTNKILLNKMLRYVKFALPVTPVSTVHMFWSRQRTFFHIFDIFLTCTTYIYIYECLTGRNVSS